MWEQTDELQFVKTIKQNKSYEVVETIDVARQFYVVDIVYVELDDYSDSELSKEVGAYYESLEEIKSIYKKDWGLIVAEIIGENSASLSDGKRLENYSDVVGYLKKEYEIIVQ